MSLVALMWVQNYCICSYQNERTGIHSYDFCNIFVFFFFFIKSASLNQLLLCNCTFLTLFSSRYTWAHIWACPPSEGDDYIFHCHPPEQKIPKPKRLSEWYKKMLDKAVNEKVIHSYQVSRLCD